MKILRCLLMLFLINPIFGRDFSTVSIEKVARFWDKRPCNIRHSNQPIGTRAYFDEVEQRKYFVEPHIKQFAEFETWRGKRVLEIGCGMGTEAVNFARAGAILTVIELSPESLELTKKRFAIYGLTANFILGNAEELDKFLPEVEYFDLIWSFGVIHHSPNPETILNKCKSLLKQNGELRMMVYAKLSYKLFYLMHETGVWDFNAVDDLLAGYSEAQTGCPITYSYTLEEAQKLFAEFKILNIFKTHIFPWNIEKYIAHQYEKEACFKQISPELFKQLEAELGWHLLIRAQKI